MSAPKSNSLYPFFDYCLQNSLPFALYRLPETNVIHVIAQKHNKLIKLPKGQNISAKKGFLFAPFQEDENYRRLLISPDIFTTADKLPALTFAAKTPKAESAETRIVKLKEATKQQYIVYVKNIQLNIKKGTFKKVVAARVVKKKKPGSFNAISFFETLCEKYPAAFTSLVYTPLYGLWIGATPEILLQVDNTGFKTYSLAGTKANTTQNANNTWGQKEKE